MSGDNEHNMDLTNLAPDEPCSGCQCGCGCAQCFCRFDLVADDSNRDHYTGEGGMAHPEGVPTLPIDIAADQFPAILSSEASFDTPIIEPNEAPQATIPSFALTQANINQLVHSHNETDSYPEAWLRQHRLEVDENPARFFISVVNDPEMYEEEGVFGPLELESSMHVEDGNLGDSYSTISQLTCPRSHSSRSASQVLSDTGNFISRPLPLLPDVPELTCPNCGCEHE